MSVIGKNLVWLLMNQIATWAVSFVVLFTVPDLLGPTGLGELGYATAFVGFFGLLASFGTSPFLVKEVARDHSLVGPWVFNGAVMKAVVSVALSAVALLVAVALGNTGRQLTLIGLACISMVFATILEMFLGGLHGMSRMAKPSAWMTAQVYLASIGGVLVLLAGGSVVGYSLVFTVAATLPLIAAGRMVWPYLTEHMHLDSAIWRRMAIGGIAFFTIGALNLVYGTIGIPILKQISGTVAVGWYDLAARWSAIPFFIVSATGAAFFPSFSAAGANNPDELRRLANRALRLVLVTTMPASIGLALVADELVATFHEARFANSVPVIRIAAIEVPFAAMDTLLAMCLIATDSVKRYIPVTAVAALVNPLLCVVAINVADSRLDNGAIGLAVVSLATELLIMVGALRLRPRGVLDRPMLLWIARCAAAALTLVPVLILLDGRHLAIQIAAGVVCYGIGSLAFRSVRPAELRQARDHLVRAIGARPRRNADARSDDGPADGDPDFSGDLHTEPGGQDRGGGEERVGDRSSIVRPDDHRPEHE